MTTSYIQKTLTATGILALSSLVSRILGLVRDHIFANKFGAISGIGIFDIDAYYAAFRMPDMLFNLLIFGTISSAFIPIFVDYIKKENKEEGWNFTNAAFNMFFVIMMGLSIVVFIGAPWIMKIMVPGFSTEKLELTVNLTRIMLISPIFFTMSAFAQSIQNAFNYFVFYALAPILYNLGIIGGTLYWGEEYGVYGATIGVVIGSALHFISQIPGLAKLKYRYRLIFDTKREDVKQMIKLVIPRIVGLSGLQITILIYTIIASTLATGSIAIFNYAINLHSLPMGIIGISTAIASFAALSKTANPSEKSKFTEQLSQSTQSILFLIIPATFGMIALREPITALILQGGAFGSRDVTLTSNTLGIMVISLFAHSLIPLFGRAFYAWKNTRTPVIISLWSSLISIITAIIFTKYYTFGVYGLAIGFSVSSIINVIWLGLAFRKKLNISLTSELTREIETFIIASGAMLAIVQLTQYMMQEYHILLRVGASVLVGIVVYGCITYLMKSKETEKYIAHIRRRP